MQLAEYAAARTKYEQALPLYRELGTRLGEAHCIRALGDVHRVLAEYASARDRYEQALALYRELGTRLDEANVYWELGRMEFRLGTIVEGYETVRRAAQLYTAIGIPFAATAQAWLAEHRARYLAEKAEQEQRTQAQAIQPYRELIEWVVEGSRNNPDARQLAQAKIEALRREGHTAELAESLDRILNKGMRVEKRLVQFLENSEHVAVVREILRRLGM
ncbi:MAG: tetratricopeptide repeat protein [Anaerolineales bacterium]|nr:tetratricopeptide repeat protein [Anaerolineales bacterium]